MPHTFAPTISIERVELTNVLSAPGASGVYTLKDKRQVGLASTKPVRVMPFAILTDTMPNVLIRSYWISDSQLCQGQSRSLDAMIGKILQSQTRGMNITSRSNYKIDGGCSYYRDFLLGKAVITVRQCSTLAAQPFRCPRSRFS